MKHLILGSSSDSESSDSADMSDGNTRRPSSPESISSSWLLPDSPVPEFMRILSSYFMDPTSYDRYPSPVSLSSDSEFVALPVECWTDNPRPLSPASLESEKKFCFDDELSSEVSPHTWGETSSVQPEQTKLATVSSSPIKSAKEYCPHLQQMTESTSKFWICKEETFHRSKADEDAGEYLSPKPSTAKDVKQKDTKTQQKSGEELQGKPTHHGVRHKA
uniref:PPUP7558 n=1 Tax=Poeciliopsis prolifica TaxID=188132 RepID=A0A0S7EN79_9TELE